MQFDNLTRRHSISRLLDGRVEDARVTEDETVVREWLTAFDKLPLFKFPEPRAVESAFGQPAENIAERPFGK